MRIQHGFSFLRRTFYMPFNEKEPSMKGIKMSQNSKDKTLLLLEWESQFAALTVVAELNMLHHKK